MLRNGHVRFGRRPAETRPGKPGQGAAGRPHTEHPTREGKVYCAVVLDVCSRRVVGWAIDSSPTAALTTNALGMAIDNRAPDPGAVIHSDHGVQFGSWVFTRRARTNERKLLRPSVRPTHSGSPVDLCCLLFRQAHQQHSRFANIGSGIHMVEYGVRAFVPRTSADSQGAHRCSGPLDFRKNPISALIWEKLRLTASLWRELDVKCEDDVVSNLTRLQ